MKKYELTKEWIRENAELIKDGYTLSMGNKYDITSEEDVLKLLRNLDPENATEVNAKVFSAALKLFSSQVKEKFEPEEKITN